MITDDMIHGAIPRPPRRRIQNDTPVVPRAVAEGVVEEASVYLKTELPRAWVRRLAVHANMVYQHNDHFCKLLRKKGDVGRDWLWTFSRHWLAALIARHYPELHARLPVEYNTGGGLRQRSSVTAH